MCVGGSQSRKREDVAREVKVGKQGKCRVGVVNPNAYQGQSSNLGNYLRLKSAP